MFTSTVLVGFIALFCSSFSLVDGRTVKRDVVSPPITYPTTGTVWNVNDKHNVTWDTSVIPPGTTNNGMIVLGFLDSADGSNEHLDLNNPLASGFPITAGRAEITVPSVTTRDTYILVLFGDSGNASGKFTINNISISTTSSSTAASSSGPPASASTADVQSDSSGQDTSTALSSAASSIPNGVSGSGTGTVVAAAGPASSASAPSSASSAVSSGVSATQTQPAAQSASPSGSLSNAGVRSASYGGAATWISTMCSLAVVVGFAL
ncbi:hypothetical protein JB92DRAFT_2805852 [Gautieria morchelliformis]|nr:hypothetical protein JB92DRAFT_2805852 [Gautieria morchelliformis]